MKKHLEQTFNYTVETKARIRSLNPTYDANRRQFISPRLLSRLRRMKKDQDDKILGIVDVDLYSPGFEFVFGEAEMSTGVATVSLYRLQQDYHPSNQDEKVFETRAIKEAVHELGHLYHLGHCSNSKCVMYFSTSIVDIDRKRDTFCTKCHKELSDKIVH